MRTQLLDSLEIKRQVLAPLLGRAQGSESARRLEQGFKFFNPETLREREFIVALSESGEIQGLACFVERSFRAPACVGIAYIEVAPSWRGKGLGRVFCDLLVAHAAMRGQGISVGSWEPDGLRWLRPHLIEACARSRVPLVE